MILKPGDMGGLGVTSGRLGLLDVLLWNVPPQILVGDALWCLG